MSDRFDAAESARHSCIFPPKASAKYQHLSLFFRSMHISTQVFTILLFYNRKQTITPYTTGNFHGMPVYYISDLSDLHKNSCQISLENIAYIGVRDVDVAEIKILKENNVKNYTKEEIIRRGRLSRI